MGRPLSSAFRAFRDRRHPVRGNGTIMGARPLPGFAGWNPCHPGNAPQEEEAQDPWPPDDDPALLAFADDVTGTVPQGDSREAVLDQPGPADRFELFDDEEFDYDPLGLGLSIA